MMRLSENSATIEIMFESVELPSPDVIADLDDLELLDAMAVATVVETAAIDVRIAVIEEIYRRQMRATAGTRPQPAHPRAALPSPRRRRRRKARKRRNRR